MNDILFLLCLHTHDLGMPSNELMEFTIQNNRVSGGDWLII